MNRAEMPNTAGLLDLRISGEADEISGASTRRRINVGVAGRGQRILYRTMAFPEEVPRFGRFAPSLGSRWGGAPG